MTQINSEQEFWFAYVWIGGIVFVGLIVSIVLISFGLVVRRKLKDKKIEQQIYDQERSNGQHKKQLSSLPDDKRK